MRNSNTIQVFEHKQLLIGQSGFQKHHWEAMGRYIDRFGDKFFSLTLKGIKFNQYVGVIQVDGLTIEILPKISQVVEKDDKTKWQKVLIDMLRECRWMKISAHDKANLCFKSNSILDAYLELFILECEELLRQGLVKKYRSESDNCNTLKGKLLFHKQIQQNLVHKEKFFTKHQVYDKENIYNQILLKALKLIPKLSQSPFLKDRVFSLIFSFPELEDIAVNESTFQNLIFDRKTSRYKEAIEIAAMLLLNFRPDINAGQNHILAILFDMNDLWEEYIYRQLCKTKPINWTIQPQNSQSFWKLCNSNYSKTIKPDIVIQNLVSKQKIILDTKWKLPEKNTPADNDLKQMFVYNEFWNSTNAILVYPNAKYTDIPHYLEGSFLIKDLTKSKHSCGVMKMAVLDKQNSCLDLQIGQRINEFLKKEIFK
jgi:5-methylcytosine-specific restriction enzyme subunit McrC